MGEGKSGSNYKDVEMFIRIVVINEFFEEFKRVLDGRIVVDDCWGRGDDNVDEWGDSEINRDGEELRLEGVFGFVSKVGEIGVVDNESCKVGNGVYYIFYEFLGEFGVF